MTTRTPVKYWPSDQSGPAARSSASQVWRWVSMKPGMAIMFVPSMISAPSAGIEGATAAIFVPSIRMSPRWRSPIFGSTVMTVAFL